MQSLREHNRPGVLYWAVIVSLTLHLSAFGVWKVGQARGWWQGSRLPLWWQRKAEKMISPPKVNLPAVSAANALDIPLAFVDVRQPAAAPPKQARFYGPVDAEAANPNAIKPSEIPQIDGKQEKIVRLEDRGKSEAKPLEPAPPASAEETTERKERPKERQRPGDLAFLKPQDLNRQDKGKSENETAETDKNAQKRPRRLSEVKRSNSVRSDKLKQEGGVNKLALSSSLDVRKTAYGSYDRDFVDAVQQHWDSLVEQVSTFHEGKVVVQFRLHYDGRISEMKVLESNAGELLTVLCQKAILDPAPFEKWPMEMRKEIKADYRDLTFTFFYMLF